MQPHRSIRVQPKAPPCRRCLGAKVVAADAKDVDKEVVKEVDSKTEKHYKNKTICPDCLGTGEASLTVKNL